jgi:acetyl-CoA acyltransferase
MSAAFVVDACRTPIGKLGGGLASVRPDDLTALAIAEILRRNPSVAPDAVDDVVWGDTNQAGEDNRNVARMGLLLAGLPEHVPGVTVNRLCGSGLQAIVSAAHLVLAGEADVCIAGGVESMTRAPFALPRAESAFPRTQAVYDTRLGWRFVNPRWEARYRTLAMGETAEEVASRYGVSRERQDEFALASHRKAAAAWEAGRFDGEVFEVTTDTGDVVTRDESVRRDTSIEALAELRPAFVPGGTVTAGNSSPMNDGAAAALVVSEDALGRHGLEPLVRYVSSGRAGVHPDVMGIGPVPAVRQLLARTGWTLDSVDLIELNEAFASQALACVDELKLDPEVVNVNGGAIAIGHPTGCSGARIAGTLLHEMRRREVTRGIATMCIGVGQGIAVAFDAT